MTASGDTSRRLTRLEEQMQQLSGRVTALERATGRPAAPASRVWRTGGAAEPAEPETGEPVFVISGEGQLGGGPISIRQRARLSDVLHSDPDAAARVFAALASPARVTLLRALLDGPRTSQQLRSELDDASVGQLYHHLRELLAAGLIIQPARSQYAIRRGALVMLCAQLVAAGRLAAGIPVPDDEPPAAEPGPGTAEPR